MSRFSIIAEQVVEELKEFVPRTSKELAELGIDAAEDVKAVYDEFEKNISEAWAFKDYPATMAELAERRSYQLANQIGKITQERARLTVQKIIGEGFKFLAQILKFFAP